MREDLSGKSEVQNREARFHEELRKRGVHVLAGRGEKSEYYEGSLRLILEALRSSSDARIQTLELHMVCWWAELGV